MVVAVVVVVVLVVLAIHITIIQEQGRIMAVSILKIRGVRCIGFSGTSDKCIRRALCTRT